MSKQIEANCCTALSMVCLDQQYWICLNPGLAAGTSVLYSSDQYQSPLSLWKIYFGYNTFLDLNKIGKSLTDPMDWISTNSRRDVLTEQNILNIKKSRHIGLLVLSDCFFNGEPTFKCFPYFSHWVLFYDLLVVIAFA